jgi:deoxyribodipyrimidine photo-lyase
VPLYCFDPRQFGETHFGFPKTGAFRAQFLRESIQDLQRSFQKLGSALIIRVGKPESIIPTLIEPLHITSVYYHTEITTEEQVVELALQRSLQMHHIPYRAFWGNTLYHPDDLPFDRSNIPELFTTFRKQVEKHANIQPALPSPQTLCPWHLPSEGSTPTSPPSTVEIGDIPRLGDTLGDFNLQPIVPDPRAVLAFQGGETAGLTRLQQYFWQRDQLRHYKETRNGLLGADYSSKFSAWLAAGCLSPRYIYQQVRQYERERVQNDSTYWLIFELLWRDYFQLISAKHGDRIFYRSGLQRLPIAWKQDWQRFDLWRAGKTGYPFVDANLKELAATGFMSNRGRQNVASFLTKNLGIDWRMGAEWFESTLIDYDVCSNWGNWNYSAGIGNDARGFRFFNITKQAQTYDPEGSYVKHWLPELVAIPAARIHEPWKLSRDEQKQYGVRLGVDYPHPIVDLLQSAATEEKRYKEAIARR